MGKTPSRRSLAEVGRDLRNLQEEIQRLQQKEKDLQSEYSEVTSPLLWVSEVNLLAFDPNDGEKRPAQIRLCRRIVSKEIVFGRIKVYTWYGSSEDDHPQSLWIDAAPGSVEELQYGYYIQYLSIFDSLDQAEEFARTFEPGS